MCLFRESQWGKAMFYLQQECEQKLTWGPAILTRNWAVFRAFFTSEIWDPHFPTRAWGETDLVGADFVNSEKCSISLPATRFPQILGPSGASIQLLPQWIAHPTQNLEGLVTWEYINSLISSLIFYSCKAKPVRVCLNGRISFSKLIKSSGCLQTYIPSRKKKRCSHFLLNIFLWMRGSFFAR